MAAFLTIASFLGLVGTWLLILALWPDQRMTGSLIVAVSSYAVAGIMVLLARDAHRATRNLLIEIGPDRLTLVDARGRMSEVPTGEIDRAEIRRTRRLTLGEAVALPLGGWLFESLTGDLGRKTPLRFPPARIRLHIAGIQRARKVDLQRMNLADVVHVPRLLAERGIEVQDPGAKHLGV